MQTQQALDTVTKVCVAGPGAVGTTIAALLAHRVQKLTIVARGESLRAIGDNGVHLVRRHSEHQAMTKVTDALETEQDIVFLCTKAHDLPSVARLICGGIGENTTLVPIVNGIPWWYFEGDQSAFRGRNIKAVDPDNELKELLPSSHVIGAIAMFTAERLGPGIARALNPIKIVIGEIDDQPRKRIHKVIDLLTRCGIEARASYRIRDPLWTKIIANLMSSPLSVVVEAPLKDICSAGELPVVAAKLIEEGLLTAASFGARVELSPKALLDFGAGMGEAKTSMLQDFESKRPLELGAICDAVFELAELQGLSMPLSRHIAALARYKSDLSLAKLPQ